MREGADRDADECDQKHDIEIKHQVYKHVHVCDEKHPAHTHLVWSNYPSAITLFPDYDHVQTDLV